MNNVFGWVWVILTGLMCPPCVYTSGQFHSCILQYTKTKYENQPYLFLDSMCSVFVITTMSFSGDQRPRKPSNKTNSLPRMLCSAGFTAPLFQIYQQRKLLGGVINRCFLGLGLRTCKTQTNGIIIADSFKQITSGKVTQSK